MDRADEKGECDSASPFSCLINLVNTKFLPSRWWLISVTLYRVVVLSGVGGDFIFLGSFVVVTLG